MARKQSEMSFELIGGIYIVERFADGKEIREEIDGLTVLQLLLEITEKHAKEVLDVKKKNK